MKIEGKDQPWRDLMGAVVRQAYVDWARAWYTTMNKKLRVYIAGPMTGIEGYNRLAFREAADWIDIMGLEPVHTADMPDGLEYDDYIAESLERLKTCDMIFLLPGWSASRGVVLHELPCALGCGIPATEERMKLVHIAGEMAKKKLDDEDKS